MPRVNRFFSLTTLILALVLTTTCSASDGRFGFVQPAYAAWEEPEDGSMAFLPVVTQSSFSFDGLTGMGVNVPYIDGDIRLPHMAVFWFGRVTPTENYADVRVGYNNDELYVNLVIFDRQLWRDGTPSASDLTDWDATTLLLSLNGNRGNAPGQSAFRLDVQLGADGSDGDYQATYRGNGTDWVGATIPFTAITAGRGEGPNDDSREERGWMVQYHIPFTSLGLNGPPPLRSVWGLGIKLYDQDDSAGTPIPDKAWPTSLVSSQPVTWGQMAFGMPSYAPPASVPAGSVSIRQGQDGASVVDGHVGGHSECGVQFDPNYFNGWGDANYTGYEQINVQNQSDVADWPCFSKYFITFPLDAVPPGKSIISATLTMRLFGNAGGGQWGDPPDSIIQALVVSDDWMENALTWNNAPLAWENVSSTRVNPVDSYPGWPGIPYTWDVSWAVAKAYLSGEPLRLALYSADSLRHSGKYFHSSDADLEGRPVLEVIWGN